MFGIKTLNKKLCTLNKNMFEADRRTKTKENERKMFYSFRDIFRIVNDM